MTRRLMTLSLAGAFLALPQLSMAGPREVGIKLYQRLAGVPPSGDQIAKIEALATANNLDQIAKMAMSTRSFLSTTVKAMASPMSNVSGQTSVDLNDFSAIIIGLVRDEAPMTQMLYDDVLYVGDSTALASKGLDSTKVPLFKDYDNGHFRELERQGVDLSDPSLFVRRTQSALTILPAEATMGVMTTREAGDQFLKDGTNRRMVRFAMVNFMCRDMEALHDNTISDHRVRQDVPRTPGGDSSTYINRCAGCHAGMDALAGAFAYYDFRDFRDASGFSGARVNYLPAIAPKYFVNDGTYPSGYRTVGDDWQNLWTEGQNAVLGWRPPADGSSMMGGNGAKALGMVLASTKAFSECMAQRAYAQVCSRKQPFNDAEDAAFKKVAATFEDSNYNGKTLFAESAKLCVGE